MESILIQVPRASKTVLTAKFDSKPSLETFLGLSLDHASCLAYAPHAKTAPNCGRGLSKGRCKQLSNLLSQLLDAQLPSQSAHRLLEELSERVICYKLRHPHLPDNSTAKTHAQYVYRRWYERLWQEYLALNGIYKVEHGGVLFNIPSDFISPVHRAAQWEEILRVKKEVETSTYTDGNPGRNPSIHVRGDDDARDGPCPDKINNGKGATAEDSSRRILKIEAENKSDVPFARNSSPRPTTPVLINPKATLVSGNNRHSQI